MKNLTNKGYWDNKWEEKQSQKNKILFQEIFNKYLSINPEYKCIEIGCVPGRFLVYFNKFFQYKIYGVDFANLKSIKNLFKKEKVKEQKIYKKDFNKFETKTKFDVVCSFGFIEHFDDYEEIFKKHVYLLKKNGTLILALPNFRFGQYYFHKFFDLKSLKRHNLEIMDLNIIESLSRKYNLNIQYLGYYQTADFWVDKNDKHYIFSNMIVMMLKIFSKFSNKLTNLPNKWLSPYIVLVATKK